MTAPGSGVGASLGIGAETTYGTYSAPIKWTEFESESVIWNPSRTTGAGLYAGGLVSRASQRSTTTATVAGDIVTPFYSKGMGQWLGLIFGTLNLTPTQIATTGAYTLAHALAPNQGQSATVQIGRPTMDGTAHPYNYTGVKVTKAVFEAKVNEPLRLTLSIDGKDVAETPSLVTPVYQSANPAYFWNQGQFEMGALGSEVLVEGVRSFTLTIERPQKVDNFYLDGSGRKSAPVQNDFVKITGSIETDFLSKAAFADLFVADTPQSIIVPFTGVLIGGSSSASFTLTLPHCRFDDSPPTVSGPDIIQPKMDFTALYDDTHTAVTATYVSTDILL